MSLKPSQCLVHVGVAPGQLFGCASVRATCSRKLAGMASAGSLASPLANAGYRPDWHRLFTGLPAPGQISASASLPHASVNHPTPAESRARRRCAISKSGIGEPPQVVKMATNRREMVFRICLYPCTANSSPLRTRSTMGAIRNISSPST
jgi:hypothetical protein